MIFKGLWTTTQWSNTENQKELNFYEPQIVTLSEKNYTQKAIYSMIPLKTWQNTYQCLQEAWGENRWKEWGESDMEIFYFLILVVFIWQHVFIQNTWHSKNFVENVNFQIVSQNWNFKMPIILFLKVLVV